MECVNSTHISERNVLFINSRYLRACFASRVKRQLLLRLTSLLIKAWTRFVSCFEAGGKVIAEFSEWKTVLFCGHHYTSDVRKVAYFSIRGTRIHTYRIMRHVLFTTYLCRQPNMRLNLRMYRWRSIANYKFNLESSR